MNNHQTRPSVAISRRTMLKALGAGTAVVPLAGRVPVAAAADPIKIGLLSRVLRPKRVGRRSDAARRRPGDG